MLNVQNKSPAGYIRIGLLALAVILVLNSAVYQIMQDERGVLRRFGKVTDKKVPAGIHVKFPWPVDKIDKVRATTVFKMSVGFRMIDMIQGIEPSPDETQMLTGDTNILNTRMIVQYTINEPADFLFMVETPQWLVRKTAETALATAIGKRLVDDVLTIARPEIEMETRINAQKLLDGFHAGIRILSASLQTVDPPREVVNAFQEVSSAKADKQRLINEAQGYANEVIPQAQGEAERILSEARGYRDSAIAKAQGETERFNKILEKYRLNRDATTIRLYIEMAEAVFPVLKKVYVDSSDKEPVNFHIVNP